MAIDRARDIVSEVATGAAASQIEAATLLKVVAAISVFGFMFVTGGTIALAAIEAPRIGPVPFFIGIAGYTAIVAICRHLLRLIPAPAQKGEAKRQRAQPPYTVPPIAPGSTNRSLAEGAVPYHSITEQTTRQFEGKQRDNG
ncbi:MAG TPA: hypothetical protein VFD58_23475 [Blastocatellia bacterium]|nr:hypothetical protein [Blastocatellia bacterium]